ncbi:hypothetical protein AMATHDRAFT_7943 [Amanita thiersii Skay4041]|uniref:Uncharacterized protein n=1 Tax=Amanita thiersii Skay4041 TaxID=703135 RepID=A0A2A9NFB9_9AGAR|nr:hypothetical protein AMATHDRAFT_7943 [Amanita thiersii Skay4041]
MTSGMLDTLDISENSQKTLGSISPLTTYFTISLKFILQASPFVSNPSHLSHHQHQE